ISTVTSPSEKRPTAALPSSTPRCVAISWASDGLALPVNSTVLNSTSISGGAARTGVLRMEDLAGEEGLEPSHVGIKIRCLDQLGDSPTPVHAPRVHLETLLFSPAPTPTR